MSNATTSFLDLYGPYALLAQADSSTLRYALADLTNTLPDYNSPAYNSTTATATTIPPVPGKIRYKTAIYRGELSRQSSLFDEDESREAALRAKIAVPAEGNLTEAGSISFASLAGVAFATTADEEGNVTTWGRNVYMSFLSSAEDVGGQTAPALTVVKLKEVFSDAALSQLSDVEETAVAVNTPLENLFGGFDDTAAISHFQTLAVERVNASTNSPLGSDDLLLFFAAGPQLAIFSLNQNAVVSRTTFAGPIKTLRANAWYRTSSAISSGAAYWESPTTSSARTTSAGGEQEGDLRGEDALREVTLQRAGVGIRVLVSLKDRCYSELWESTEKFAQTIGTELGSSNATGPAGARLQGNWAISSAWQILFVHTFTRRDS